MRLTRLGRLIYAGMALANLWLLLPLIPDAEWLGIVIYGALTGIFGWPAISGRDPLAGSSQVPRWFTVPEASRDHHASRDEILP